MTLRLRSLLLASSIALTSLPLAAHAEPGGCLKYGAAGAVAGHFAHRHTLLGAGAGCVAGMYRRHLYRKDLRQKAQAYDAEHPSGSSF